ncbi:MAG: PilZ domain-containing protein [Zoogloeaceae bacterium]|jgi:type IV pilus assembly protein PilZ|nr:PilZ domain-containing protein [Zoogloeaceae bacterium]
MSMKPGGRPSVLSLNINSKPALYAAYVPILRNGGIFIPTTRPYSLGEEVFILLSLLDDPAKMPVVGKVVWVSPANAQNNRPQGIGIHFNSDESGAEAKRKIETILAGTLTSQRPTHTV